METYNHSIEVNDILSEVILGGDLDLNERVHLFEMALQNC